LRFSVVESGGEEVVDWRHSKGTNCWFCRLPFHKFRVVWRRKIAGQGGKPYKCALARALFAGLRLHHPPIPKWLSLGFAVFHTCAQLGRSTISKSRAVAEKLTTTTKSTNLTTQPKPPRCRPHRSSLASRLGRFPPPPRRPRNGTLPRMSPSRARYVIAQPLPLTFAHWGPLGQDLGFGAAAEGLHRQATPQEWAGGFTDEDGNPKRDAEWHFGSGQVNGRRQCLGDRTVY